MNIHEDYTSWHSSTHNCLHFNSSTKTTFLYFSLGIRPKHLVFQLEKADADEKIELMVVCALCIISFVKNKTSTKVGRWELTARLPFQKKCWKSASLPLSPFSTLRPPLSPSALPLSPSVTPLRQPLHSGFAQKLWRMSKGVDPIWEGVAFIVISRECSFVDSLSEQFVFTFHLSVATKIPCVRSQGLARCAVLSLPKTVTF